MKTDSSVLFFDNYIGKFLVGNFIETQVVCFFIFGQAMKGARWMPRYRWATKDVVSCVKLRGAANTL